MLRKCKPTHALALLLVMSTWLLGFGGRPGWGDPSRRVWYHGALVPFGVLLDRGVVPHCHDGLGPGIITCFDTREELAAATGADLAGVNKVVVEQLRSTGVVAQVQRDYYACVYDGYELTGRSFLLSNDYTNFQQILFDNVTSSIEIPGGAGYSTHYADPGYGGSSWCFNMTKNDLHPYGLDNTISSARRGCY